MTDITEEADSQTGETAAEANAQKNETGAAGQAQNSETADGAEPAEDLLTSEFTVQETGVSGLALLKQQQTGKATREEGSSDLAVSLTEAVLGQLTSDLMAEIMYSCEQTRFFEPGETESYITFKILHDKLTEGTETFNLMIVDAEDAEPYGAISASVCIEDDEAVEHSVLSFDRANYSGRNGSVKVTVSRTGALYSMATAKLKGKLKKTDPESGEQTEQEEIFGEMVFMPYEDSKEAELCIGCDAVLELYDLKAADPGERITASVKNEETEPEEGTEEMEGESTELLEAPRGQDFYIWLNGKKYTVKSEANAPYGRIYDTFFTPAVEVGIYVFPASADHNGWFDYGYDGYDTWNRESYFNSSDNYGHLFWHNWKTWNKGSSYLEIRGKHPELCGMYYQYVVPEWEETRYAYGGQQSWFTLSNCSGASSRRVRYGEFERSAEAAMAVKVQGDDDYLKVRAAAVDDIGSRTPKNEVHVFGFAFMYKRFTISSQQPDLIQFRHGTELTDRLYPFQFQVKCGAQTWASTEQRDIFANPNTDKSNLVFTTLPVLVNGMNNKFATISGFKITVSPGSGDQTVYLNYPEDFLNWLEGPHNLYGETPMDYSAASIRKEKEKVTAHLDTVPYDAYFIAWIESCQKKVFEDGMNGSSYYQRLDFKPVYKVIESKVTVLTPEGTKPGEEPAVSFVDPELRAGTKVTYKAGDVLDLSVKVNDPAKASEYTNLGYEVKRSSRTKADPVFSTTELKLEPYEDYEIRPIYSDVYNGIEVEISEAAKGILSLENQVIAKSELPSHMKNGTYLNLNPNASTVKEKMKVEPGKIYSVNILVNQAPMDPEYEYRPVFTDSYTHKSYNGQRYDFTGRSKEADNKIYVDVEKVKKSDCGTYDLNGIALMALPSVVNDALGLHKTAAVGYTAILGNGQGVMKDTKTQRYLDYVKSVTGDVGTDGTFRLKGVRGKEGDRFTVLLSQGVADGQIIEVRLNGNGGAAALGEIKMNYPSFAPRVTSLSYRYMIDENNHKTDITQNSVRMFDDELQITATVASNGRTVEKLIFTSESPASGIKKDYEIKAEKEGQEVFIIRLPNLLKNFNNGDRISVRVVEKYSPPGSTSAPLSIGLPKVETGYVMYTENELIMPKEFSVYCDPATQLGQEVNIPLIGSGVANAESGKLGVTREDWPGGGGYSVFVNLDCVLYGDATLSQNDKFAVRKEYIENTAKVTAGRKEEMKEKQEKQKPSIPDKDSNADSVIEKSSVRKEPVDQKKIQEGADAKAKMTKDAKMECHFLACLDLEFVYNPSTTEYILSSCAVTLGGSGGIDKTFYTVIIKVPCYLNLRGEGQISLTMGGVTQKAKNALSAGEFNSYTGNIRDMLADSGKFMWQYDITGLAKGQVGVGICGVLGARGFITVGLEGQLTNNRVSDNRVGFLISGSGGLGLDLLIFSLEYPFINAAKGLGTLKDKTKVTLFNGERSLYGSGSTELLTEDENSATWENSYGETDETEETEELIAQSDEVTISEYSAGADVSAFGQFEDLSGELLGAQPAMAEREILLTPAATRTRPQLLDLGDGRELLTFLGADGTDQESSVLYYTVRDLDGQWSAPEAVSANGSYQSQSSLLKKGDKIYLAWLETGKSYSRDESYAEKLSSFEVRMTELEYDTVSGTVKGGERNIIDVCTLPYMCYAVSLTEENGRIFCSYMLTDYSKSEKDEDLSDLSKYYTTAAVTEIDADTLTVVPYKNEKGTFNERLIRIEHPTLTDPLVTDSQTSAQTVGSGEDQRELLVSAYTVNGSPNAATDSAKELYLRIEDVTGGELRSWYPIRLTNDETGKAFPTLTELNGKLYLSWISGGKDFHIMNVTSLLNAVFAPDCGLADNEEGNAVINKTIREAFLKETAGSSDWYQKTAEELGLTEEEYENSFYALIGKDSFNIEESGIGCQSSGVHNITSHELVSDGKDIFILYTDLSTEPEDNGVELYGMRYSTGDGDDKDPEQEIGPNRFSDPVQISDDGMVMDEMSAFMGSDGVIHTASNLFEQYIDSRGKIAYGENSLVHTVYQPKQSVKVKGDKLELPEILIPGTSELLSFDVINGGLYPADGFSVRVTEETPDGVTKILEEQEYDICLDVNETVGFGIPWTVPGHVEGTVFRAEIREKCTAPSDPYVVSAQISAGEQFEMKLGESFIGEDGQMHVTGTVFNIGNSSTSPAVLQLSFIESGSEESGDEGYRTALIKELEIPSLDAGEEFATDISFEPEGKYFDDYGQVRMIQELKQDGITIEDNYPWFYSPVPLAAEINGGAERLNLRPGSSKKLSVEIIPQNELAGELMYASMDPDVAEVSRDGTVTAAGRGSTTVYVYDPVNFIYGELEVNVTDTPAEDGEEEDSSSSVTLPSWVVKDGSWTAASDGRWQYTRNGKPVSDSWLCIYNPFADTGKNQKVYSWFRFDKDGWMQTGWFDDRDGNRYYLHPASDGTKGSMAAGWRQIDGKWYYFSEKEGSGYYGAMQKDTTTPDGYSLDKNGVRVK